MKNLFVFLILFSVSLVHAKTQSSEFERRWSDYEQKAKQRKLQEDCKPRRYHAKRHTPFKGTVVLHHGFTACPQQYFELAQNHLTQAGYDVLLVILPGHGGVWNKEGHDDIDALMGRKDYKTVANQFVSEINRIMAVASGEKIVGGLSVGAEFALHSTMANPELYQKLILLSPFFRLSQTNPFVSTSFRYLKDVIDNKRIGWGEACSETERQAGRAGTCEFTLDKLAALEKYGEMLLRSKLPRQIKVQIIAVKDDPVADVESVTQLYQRFQKETKNTVSYCLLPDTVNHSLLSRFDSIEEIKFWISPMLLHINDFITQGKPMPASKTKQQVVGDCKI